MKNQFKDKPKSKGAGLAVIFKDNLILSVSRKNSNKIGLPGGTCEKNESFTETMIREVFEETNVKVLSSVFVYEDHIDGYHTQSFYVKNYDDSKLNSNEGLIIKWLSFEDLVINSEYPEYNKRAIENAIMFKTSNLMRF